MSSMYIQVGPFFQKILLQEKKIVQLKFNLDAQFGSYVFKKNCGKDDVAIFSHLY